jgi:hypothetical protein
MIMKRFRFLYFLLFSTACFAQTHGQVFGSKPDTAGTVKATNLERFMDKKTRISTTISGKILEVTKEKGGWFNIDGGNGKIISAHFTDYNVSIPMGLTGKTVVAQGIAAKQFIADDQQHFAGDTVNGKKQHATKTNPKNSLTFEVKGLMVVN